MIFFLELFLVFFYFKMARIEYKEEKRTVRIFVRNFLFALLSLSLLLYGFRYYSWYLVVGMAYLFFILAALMVSAVQVGVFVDGKPFVKLTHLKNSMWGILIILLLGNLYLLGLE